MGLTLQWSVVKHRPRRSHSNTNEGRKLYAASYTLDDLKRGSGVTWKHNKNEVMEFITEKYPILRKAYLKERNNFRPYYFKMFEAIAAALLLVHSVDAT